MGHGMMGTTQMPMNMSNGTGMPMTGGGHMHHTTGAMGGGHGMHHTTGAMGGGHAGHGGGAGGVNGTNPVHHMMMAMSFYVSSEVNPLLFPSWVIKTPGEMVGSCIALIIVSILYEGLKVMREILKRKEATLRSMKAHHASPSMPKVQVTVPVKMLCSWYHLVQTVLHMIQVAVGYILMLAVMCYNVWIFLAVIVGSGLGYFLFGWKKDSVLDTSDHCN